MCEAREALLVAALREARAAALDLSLLRGPAYRVVEIVDAALKAFASQQQQGGE